ncbi:MAG: NAD(P)/FAD-dependent oxidoreductase [Candidatus Bathyarchaeia archaeon]
MEIFSDLIVVGGGPSGSFCALNTAKRNINVTVFEEHNEIGVPCHCAGHLSISGLNDLELYPLPKNIVKNIFRGAKIYSPSGLEFSVRFFSPLTCAVDRSLFDKHLAYLAKKAGANFLFKSRVERLILEKGFVKGVEANVNGKTLKILGKIVVDAEGASYKILRQTGLLPPAKDSFVNCVNAEVENVENIELDTVEVFLGTTYAPGFYAWLIPLNDGKVKVGLGAKTGNPKAFLQRLMHKHPAASKKLKRAKILREALHPIPLSGPVKAYSNGFLAVGDAAAQVKPTTGGGVIFGLNCAKIAADVAAEALEKNDYTSKFLRLYQQRFTKLLGFDIKVMKAARKMLEKLPDKKLDKIIDFCNKIRLDLDLLSLKEVDFQGQTFLRMWNKTRALATLTYSLLIACLKT